VFGRYGHVDSIIPADNAARAVIYESFELYFRFWPRDPFELTILGTPLLRIGGASGAGSGPDEARTAFETLDTWCRARLPKDFIAEFEQGVGPRHGVRNV
jgi:hypothetical protein